MLVADETCLPCSRLAQEVQQLLGDRIGLASISDKALAEQCDALGIKLPDRPSLLISAPTPRLLGGWRMRLEIMRMLGPGRPVDALRLAREELAIRLAAKVPESRSRRKVLRLLGGGGATAMAVMFAGNESANATSAHSRAASTREQSRIMASPSARRALRHWGAVDPSRTLIADTPSGTAAFLFHERTKSITVLDQKPCAQPVEFTLKTRAGLYGPRIRFWTVDGEFLGQLIVQADGRTTADSVATSVAAPGWNGARIACFFACMAFNTNNSCANDCLEAANGGGAFAYALCIGCAGKHGYQMRKEMLGE